MKVDQQLYLASSFRGPGVDAMIMEDIEKLIGKQPNEISISYITTAGNLHPTNQRSWIDEGREILKRHGWEVFDYDIEGKDEAEVEKEISERDVIFVQGGNNFYLLQQMHNCNFREVLGRALAKGVPYIGESAGAIVCAKDLTMQKYMSGDLANVVELDNYTGLGLVNFLIKPHWNRVGAKREKFSKFLRENPEEFYSIKQPIICLNDNQVIRVDGENFQIWESSAE